MGKALNVLSSIGARNIAKEEREAHDFYCTPPRAVELLLEKETFCRDIWEPACGAGHISRVLEEHGYNVLSSDLYDHGFGNAGIDFLRENAWTGMWNPYFDIITNPPYSHAVEFVRHALDIVAEGHMVAMFLKIQFLEGKARRKLFDEFPPPENLHIQFAA